MIITESLNAQLTSLRATFDQAIINGKNFSEVKDIFTQIKEIEKKISERAITLYSPAR